jgi:hypothetical protein
LIDALIQEDAGARRFLSLPRAPFAHREHPNGLTYHDIEHIGIRLQPAFDFPGKDLLAVGIDADRAPAEELLPAGFAVMTPWSQHLRKKLLATPRKEWLRSCRRLESPRHSSNVASTHRD